MGGSAHPVGASNTAAGSVRMITRSPPLSPPKSLQLAGAGTLGSSRRTTFALTSRTSRAFVRYSIIAVEVPLSRSSDITTRRPTPPASMAPSSGSRATAERVWRGEWAGRRTCLQRLTRLSSRHGPPPLPADLAGRCLRAARRRVAAAGEDVSRRYLDEQGLRPGGSSSMASLPAGPDGEKFTVGFEKTTDVV